MRKIILIVIALALLGSACNKKEKEQAAKEAARKAEVARKDSLYKANINSIGDDEVAWINWLVDNKGFDNHELIVATLSKGGTFNYTYEDTLRKGKLPRTISVPKFSPQNAYLPSKGREKYTINTWGERTFHVIESKNLSNPAPAGMIKFINDPKLLLGGYIINPEIGAWFLFDIPGFMSTFRTHAETGVDSFLMTEEHYPGLLYVQVYEAIEKKEDGKMVYEKTTLVGKYYVKEDGSVVNK